MIRAFPAISLLGLIALAYSHQVSADALPVPSGPVILSVSGAITRTNVEGNALFDRDMLATLGWTTIDSFTAWTEGPQSFSGVPLQGMLTAVGAEGTVIVARALNDYSAEIPISDADRFDVFLALEQQGQPMTTRDKGPVWIIYPQHRAPGERIDPNNHKMVWQLSTLEIQ